MKEVIQAIALSDLYAFPEHPFKVVENEELQELAESITAYGVISPLVVRPREAGGYEIISGHRRKAACEKAGIDKIPAFVREMDRDTAIIALVDSNLHREHILPSEKANAYKMKLEAIKRQGKRNDLTSTPVAGKLKGTESAEIVGLEFGDSSDQVRRYIRLTNLVPELLEYVDSGKMKMRPAVELSYLDEETQRDVVDRIDETEAFPSHDQAIRIRKAYEAGEVNYEKVTDIMAEDKPNQKPKFKFSFERLKPFIPKDFTDNEAEDYVIKALEHYKKFLQKQRGQAR